MLGAKAGENAVYGRDTSKGMVVTVDSSLADELKKGADDYPRKDVFEFRAYNANHVEIFRNGQTVVFDKVKEPAKDGKDGAEKWRRVSPNAGDADKDKMDTLLSRLSNMRASSFVDRTAKTGLNAPAMTVYAKFDEGKKPERVTFGKVDADVYAARPNEPGAMKVEATDFTEANKTLDELSSNPNRAGAQKRLPSPRSGRVSGRVTLDAGFPRSPRSRLTERSRCTRRIAVASANSICGFNESRTANPFA